MTHPSSPDEPTGPDLSAIYGPGVRDVATGADAVAQGLPGVLGPAGGGPAGGERRLETPTDTGNAYRLARLLGDGLRFVPAEDRWLLWDGTRWIRDETGYAFHLTEHVCAEVRQTALSVPEDQRSEWRSWARATESAVKRRSMLEVASTLPQLVVRAEQLDAVPWLLNTAGGTVDLRTLTVRPPAPTDLLTHRTRVSLDLSVQWTAPLREFVQTFQPEPGHWEHLMLVLGSCLHGGNPFRLWLLIHGPTTTGKTQLVETVASALGDYALPVATSVFRANQDDKPRPDLLKALGARLVYASEGADTWELHADHIKRLAGGDPLVARGMRSNVMVSRVPDFTPIIVCNTIPRVKGADQAVRRRMRALEFGHSVLGMEDPAKRDQFLSHEPTQQALLSQLVIGCARALALGVEEGRPLDWVEATADAFAELTSVASFVEDLREADALRDLDATAPYYCWQLSELHDVYRTWVDRRGDHEDQRTRLGFKAFNAELRALGWETPVRSGGMRWPGKYRPPEINTYALWA